MHIGLIGCGDVVESLHLPALVGIPELQVVWACDTSLAKATRLAKCWGIPCAGTDPDELPNVDAVLLATPVGTREALLAKVFRRGWHAFCEKPFAPNAELHRGFLRQAAAENLRLGAGYMRHYYWAVGQARALLQAQTFGPLESILAGESARLERTGVEHGSYRNDSRASGGGVLMETGCHLIDELLFIADASTMRIDRCHQRVLRGFETETCAAGEFRLASGASIAVELVLSGVRSIFQGIVLRCRDGEIRLSHDPAKGLEIYPGTARTAPLIVPHPQPSYLCLLAAFRQEWIHFGGALQGTVHWDAESETGLMTSEAIEQCVRAAGAQRIEETCVL